MYLTTENAYAYVGKTIDAKRRLFLDYPLEVKQRDDGEYYYKGTCGVCCKVPIPADLFNSVYFDDELTETNSRGIANG